MTDEKGILDLLKKQKEKDSQAEESPMFPEVKEKPKPALPIMFAEEKAKRKGFWAWLFRR